MTNIHTNDRGGGISSDNSRNIPSVKEKITIIELCSGIGCQFQGIKNTPCFDPEVIATSEIDINAILSYAAIHHGLTNEMINNYHYPDFEYMRKYLTELNIGYDPEKNRTYDWFKSGKKFEELVKKVYLACVLNKNLGDMNHIKELPKVDVWFTSTPCTDISIAGKLRGMNQDDQTSSSLIWHNIRLLKEAQKHNKLPKFIFLENVKNLVGKRFLNDFEAFNELIESFGYYTHYSIINAKNCGIPQNRERLFAIYVKKDIDTGDFTFPEPFDNGLRLKNLLENDVDESYNITSQKTKMLIQQLLKDGIIGNNNANSNTKTEAREKKIGNIHGFTGGNFAGNVYDQEYLCPALNSMNGGQRQPMIVVNNNQIRKLSEKECFALQGFSFEDCDKCRNISISKSQLYKQLGNGICVNCVELLFEHLYKSQYGSNFVCYDEVMATNQSSGGD